MPLLTFNFILKFAPYSGIPAFGVEKKPDLLYADIRREGLKW